MNYSPFLEFGAAVLAHAGLLAVSDLMSDAGTLAALGANDITLVVISVRILLLPVPGIGTHLLDAVLSLPAKLLFCFVAFGVAGCDITVTARFDFVFQRMAACFLECVDHIEYAVAFAGSEVVNGNALVVSQFLDGFYMAACQVNNMDVIADTSSVRSIVVITENADALEFSDGNLCDIRKQVVRDALRILSDKAALMRSDRVDLMMKN